MHSHHYLDKRQVQRRLIIAAAIVLVLFAGLLLRMVWLQVTHYQTYQDLAEGNRIRVEPIAPIRGRIMDRNGQILADNQTVYVLELHRDELPKPRTLTAVLDKLNTLSERYPSLDDASKKQLQKQWQRMNRHLPYTIARLTEQEAAQFAIDAWQHPGFAVNAIAQRIYPQGQRAAHILGYVGRMTLEDLKSYDPENYRNTDFVGRNGIEQTYEADLHGQTGLRYVEVDAQGRQIRELNRIAPTPGKDLLLTIDLELQTFTENLLGERKGAIVALDPRNGEVLALASTPSFDPNQFVAGMNQDTYQQLTQDPKKPLLNRAIQSKYPPGSTIKPFIGLIALENDIIDAHRKKLAGHEFEYKGMIFRDWKKGGHGWVDMDTAITQSCDVYFYELALDMTIARIDEGLKQFGIGEKTGIDLNNESAGVRPNPAWKKRYYQKPWYPGETVIVGIGQGYMLTTPLQLAQATALLANRGIGFKPRLIKREAEDTQLPPIPIKQAKNWDTIIQAMTNVMHAPNGTGKRGGALVQVTMAGKTGTSQVIGIARDAEYDASALPEEQRDHALFIGFAPASKPQIAVAVMVENGGSGGGTASPLGALVVDYWLKKQGVSP
jgi:penicillin-binding protein 2